MLENSVDTNLTVRGKCNKITLMNCTNVKVEFESVVSTFEIIKCKKVMV
jgi:hypothetical protein